MKSFRQHLIETKIPKELLKNKAVKEGFKILFEISKNIKPFLKEIGVNNLAKVVLWRGIRFDTSTSFVKTIRKNRKPTDTEKRVSKVIDDWFLEKFGTRFRSSAIFVSGDSGATSLFGDPVIVLPKGSFKFVWSPKVVDLFSDRIFNLRASANIKTNNSLEFISLDPKNLLFGIDPVQNFGPDGDTDINKLKIPKAIETTIEDIQNNLGKFKYQTTGLKSGIKSKHEIMVSGKQYYIISGGNIKLFDLIEYIKKDEDLSKFLGIDIQGSSLIEIKLLNLLQIIIEKKLTI